MDWNTVLGAAAGFLLVYGLAGTIYLTVAWLRSLRKRPEPRPRGSEPQGAREITLVEQAWKEGYEARKRQMKVMEEWTSPPPSPPSSRATATSAETPPGKPDS